MNQTILLASVAAILGTAHPAYAQNEKNLYLAQSDPTSITKSLDQRYEECMNGPDCTLEAHLQIFLDLSDDMHETARRMNMTCMEMNYENCIGQQASERRQWHRRHNEISAVMKSMDSMSQQGRMLRRNETGRNMNEQEPAAGEEGESWWHGLWYERQGPEIGNE